MGGPDEQAPTGEAPLPRTAAGQPEDQAVPDSGDGTGGQHAAAAPSLPWEPPPGAPAAPAPELAEADPDPEPEERPRPPGTVRLATRPPLATLTLPPLAKGGAEVVITEEGTDLTPKDEARARRAAGNAGEQLHEL